MKKSFGKTFEIFGKNFMTVFMIVILVIVPLWAVQYFCVEKLCDIDAAVAGIEEFSESEEAQNITEDFVLPASVRSDMKKLITYVALSLVISLLSVLETCGIILLVKRKLSVPDEVVGAFGILSEGASVFPKAILAELVVLVICFMGLWMFILPGIYFYVILGFTTVAAVCTGSVRKGLFESVKTFKNNFPSALGVLVLYRVIPIAADFTLSVLMLLPFGGEVFNIAVSLITELAAGLVSAFMTMFVTVYYLGCEQ